MQGIFHCPHQPCRQQYCSSLAATEEGNTCIVWKKVSRKNWGKKMQLVKTALKPLLLLNEGRQMKGSCHMDLFLLQAFWKLVSASSCPFYQCTDWNVTVFQPEAAGNNHNCSRKAKLSVSEGEGAGVTSTLLKYTNASGFTEKWCSCLPSDGVTRSLLRHSRMQTSSSSMNWKVTAHTVITNMILHFSCCYIKTQENNGQQTCSED